MGASEVSDPRYSLREVRNGSRMVLLTQFRSPQILVRNTTDSRHGSEGSEHLRYGRVEDGRGSLGPMANAPFPISAHRTGRAELPHPALRLASPQGPQRGRSGQAF